MKIIFLFLMFTLSVDAKVKRFEVGETEEMIRCVKCHLPPCPVIFEAGCFHGRETIRFAQAWPEGWVFCFEPVPELFRQCEKNCHPFANIVCFQKAISDFTGFATCYVGFLEGYDWTCWNSLFRPIAWNIPHFTFHQPVEVATLTIDDWAWRENIERIDLLCLDIQGLELRTLEVSRLARQASAIWIGVAFLEMFRGQCLFDDIQRWMDKHGFELTGTDFDVFNPRLPFGKALFIRTTHRREPYTEQRGQGESWFLHREGFAVTD